MVFMCFHPICFNYKTDFNRKDLNLYFHLQVDGEQLTMEPEVCRQIV